MLPAGPVTLTVSIMERVPYSGFPKWIELATTGSEGYTRGQRTAGALSRVGFSPGVDSTVQFKTNQFADHGRGFTGVALDPWTYGTWREISQGFFDLQGDLSKQTRPFVVTSYPALLVIYLVAGRPFEAGATH